MVVSIVYVVLALFVPALLKRFGVNIPYVNTDANNNGIPDALEGKPSVGSVASAATADVEAIVQAVLARLNKAAPSVAAPVSVVHNADGSTAVSAPGVTVQSAAK